MNLEVEVENLKKNVTLIDNYINTLGNLSGIYGEFMPERDYVLNLMNNTYELIDRNISGINENIENAKDISPILHNHHIPDAENLVNMSKSTIKEKCNEIVNKSVCAVIGADLPEVYSYVHDVINFENDDYIYLMADENEFYKTITDDKKFIETDSKIDYSSVSYRSEEIYKNFEACLNLHKETYDFIKEMEIENKDILLQKIILSYNAHTKLLKDQYSKTAASADSLSEIHPPKDYLSFAETSMEEAMEALPDGYSEIKTNWSDGQYVSGDAKSTLEALHNQLLFFRQNTDNTNNLAETAKKIYSLREQFKDSDDLQRYLGKILFMKELYIMNLDYRNNVSVDDLVEMKSIDIPNSKDIKLENWSISFYPMSLGIVDAVYEVLETPDDSKSHSNYLWCDDDGLEILVRPFIIYKVLNERNIIPEDDVSHDKICRIDEELKNMFGRLLEYDYDIAEFYLKNSSFNDEGILNILNENPEVKKAFEYKENKYYGKDSKRKPLNKKVIEKNK